MATSATAEGAAPLDAAQALNAASGPPPSARQACPAEVPLRCGFRIVPLKRNHRWTIGPDFGVIPSRIAEVLHK